MRLMMVIKPSALWTETENMSTFFCFVGRLRLRERPLLCVRWCVTSEGKETPVGNNICCWSLFCLFLFICLLWLFPFGEGTVQSEWKWPQRYFGTQVTLDSLCRSCPIFRFDVRTMSAASVALFSTGSTDCLERTTLTHGNVIGDSATACTDCHVHRWFNSNCPTIDHWQTRALEWSSWIYSAILLTLVRALRGPFFIVCLADASSELHATAEHHISPCLRSIQPWS